MTELIEQHAIKIGVEVLGLTPPLSCHLRPLAPGLNFLSDAYFATLKVFIYNHIKCQLAETVVQAGEDEEDFVGMIPMSYQLPGKFSYERALAEPIVLEDLGAKGYSMWKDELKGLDLTHALKVVETQARYHAVGAIFLAKQDQEWQDPDVEVHFKEMINQMEIDKMFTDPLMSIIDTGANMFLEYIQRVGKDADSIRKSKAMLEDRNYVKEMLNGFEKWDSAPFQTILHGDSRGNNYMFKYDSNGETPVDVKLVDFQSSFRSVPWYDLLYFFTTSVSSDVLRSDLETILNHYRSSLAGSLARLAYPRPRPSLETIKAEMKEFAKLILPTAMTCVSIVISGNPGWSEEEKDGKLEDAFQRAKILGMI